ncbi:MAG: hypothetical protein ABI843_15260 [Dokdonella sp.]
MQYIAFAILGVGFAIEGFVDMIYIGLRLLVTTQTADMPFVALLQRDGIGLIAQGVKVALGLGLAFGARGLTGLLQRLRERGLPPAWPEEPAQESHRSD